MKLDNQVAFHSEHLGLRRPVYVGVEDAYAESHVSQGDRELGRDGRFTYPALSRCDSNDLGDAARGRLQLGFGARGSAALLDDYLPDCNASFISTPVEHGTALIVILYFS